MDSGTETELGAALSEGSRSYTCHPGLEAEPGDVQQQERERLLPLNSKRLTNVYLKRIAEALGLPTGGSSEETLQMIEGKLGEREGNRGWRSGPGQRGCVSGDQADTERTPEVFCWKLRP